MPPLEQVELVEIYISLALVAAKERVRDADAVDVAPEFTNRLVPVGVMAAVSVSVVLPPPEFESVGVVAEAMAPVFMFLTPAPQPSRAKSEIEMIVSWAIITNDSSVFDSSFRMTRSENRRISLKSFLRIFPNRFPKLRL